MKSIAKHITDWLKAGALALALLWLLQMFVFEIYLVPSNSMENTLHPQDIIIVNKLAYGARLPITPLTVPFLHQKLPNNSDKKAYLDWIQLPYHRLPGFSKPQRNDVIVFNYPIEKEHPIDHKTFYVKRIIALPGDEIKITNGRIFINDTIQKALLQEMNDYIITTDLRVNEDSLKKINISYAFRTLPKGEWQISATQWQIQWLSNIPWIYGISKKQDRRTTSIDAIFLGHKNWNRDHFGPLKVPKKGDTLKLTPKNAKLYQTIIQDYEHHAIYISHNKVFIDSLPQKKYIFQQNYYFVMGDNRHHSVDSRFWGFVPESHIIGRVKTVIYSPKSQKRNWFKTID